MDTLFYVLLKRLRSPLILLILVYATAMLGFTLIPGVDDQGQPYRMSFFHAFYFVSFMGSTIGFGEIPYAFTDAQRMWATVGIYGTVIAWLYGIGSLMTTLQDPAVRRLIVENKFRRRVRKTRQPFYIICGFGDSGQMLLGALREIAIGAVVIDSNERRIQSLELDESRTMTLGLYADSGIPEVLVDAGLLHDCCLGVIALTQDDQINLQIALSTTLLAEQKGIPHKRFISRVESRDAALNIASFGHNDVINPYEIFASRLMLALQSPGLHILVEWLSGVPDDDLQEPLFPPMGRWILCGYGRFGKELHSRLQSLGIHVTVVETNPVAAMAPAHCIHGRGTEADTLVRAGIYKANAIVAGSDNDANNLSILLTARELNPDLFLVARQNRERNASMFRAVKPDLVMQRSSVIAHKVFALIKTPLISDFLRLAVHEDKMWANQLVSRIAGISDIKVPQVWELEVSASQTHAVAQEVKTGTVPLEDMYCDPRDHTRRLACIPLLLKRGKREFLLPDPNMVLQLGDRILFCGAPSVRSDMLWIAENLDVLHYVQTGEEHPSSVLGKWLGRRKRAKTDQ